MLKPVLQMPRYRLVADQIADLIRSGQMPPGSKMPPDKDLLRQLGVSRTTVREAMIALELQGYVVTRFGAGAFVADTLPESAAQNHDLPGFFELVEARYRIEPEIAAIAAGTVSDDELAHLRAGVEDLLDPAMPLPEFEQIDRDFHLTIARSTGNSVFVSIVKEFWRVRQHFPEWTRVDNRQSAADIERFFRDEDMAIVDALNARDGKGAHAAMRVHCRNSGQPLLERWRALEETAPIGKVVARIAGWHAADPSASTTTRDTSR